MSKQKLVWAGAEWKLEHMTREEEWDYIKKLVFEKIHELVALEGIAVRCSVDHDDKRVLTIQIKARR